MHLRSSVESSWRQELAIDAEVVSDLIELLDFLPVLYPGGELWLERTLDDVDGRRADLFTITGRDSHVAAVVIGKVKPSGRYKISTLYVSPGSRGRGLGARLLHMAVDTARASGAPSVYITSASTVWDSISGILREAGFIHVARVPDRYGVGRDEDVFELAL